MRNVTYWAFPSAIRLANGITAQTIQAGGSEGVRAIRVSDSGLVELDFASTTFVVGPSGGFGELLKPSPTDEKGKR